MKKIDVTDVEPSVEEMTLSDSEAEKLTATWKEDFDEIRKSLFTDDEDDDDND